MAVNEVVAEDALLPEEPIDVTFSPTVTLLRSYTDRTHDHIWLVLEVHIARTIVVTVTSLHLMYDPTVWLAASRHNQLFLLCRQNLTSRRTHQVLVDGYLSVVIVEKSALIWASRGPVQLLQEGGDGLAEQFPEVGQPQKEEEVCEEDEPDREGMRGGGIR